MIIFSHRGLGFEKRENSLDSFKTALQEGFSLEIDVQKTKDNKLVISHDTNLKRQTGIDKNITETNYEEIKGLIPAFEEVLELIKDKEQLIAIHIKNELQGDIINLVVRKITESKLENKCFIFDVTTLGANHIKQTNPKIKVGLSLGEKRYTGTIYLWEDIKDNLEMDVVWWDEWNSELYKKENVEKIKQLKKPNYVVSPELHKIHNHPKSSNLDSIKSVWKELIDFQVGGICTDHPKELREFLKTPKTF